ncbi:SDR family oxidoreductase [Niveispirillum sp. BGYR6]|uniref:SDR family NAD(P)-dependent oxidoreductase n=1 Tax=Niveispirillum sp. BGYR6 TaxID=2971249 RepID=UPI0022B9A250|nr:SDR family oxidoreductase [Niveispirillum sp. BGYR6]MDG5495530.1 SDR family NAD(P)-dependent oxidoreductase [Niveispirillum sp. BGYR6]
MSAPIIIIGATGGVGAALARQLADQGRPLHLIGRDTARTADLAATLGASHAIADVREEAALAAAVASADQGDGLAGLAYCVGSITIKPLKALKNDDFLAAFHLNLLGAVTALRAAEKGLKAAKGSVVLFSTVAVEQGFPNHTAIATAKGAVAALGRSLAAEWAPHVRVNVIAPSLTRTPLAAPLLASEQLAQGIAAMHPIPRLGEAADQAAAAAFLLSDAAGWITGQVLGVDGGRGALRTKG